VNPNGEMHPAGVSEFQDYFLKTGAQTDKVDVDTMFDFTYLDYAIGRLGRVAP
jgi:hypothetical protein